MLCLLCKYIIIGVKICCFSKICLMEISGNLWDLRFQMLTFENMLL